MSQPSGRGPVHLSLLRERPMVAMMWHVFIATFGLEVAAPALPRIASTLDVLDARVGLVMTAFIVPSIVVLPLAGIVADLHGHRPLLLVSLLLFGAMGSAIAFVDSFLAILGLRVLQGVGFAALVLVPVAVLGDVYDGPRGATAQVLRISASGGAMTGIPPLAGALEAMYWGYPFWLHLAAFPIAPLLCLILPESGIESTDAGSGGDAIWVYGRSIREELVRPDVAMLTLGGFVHGFLMTALVTVVYAPALYYYL